ncbi:MAG: DUF6515 family protein [Thermodesulfobacteriota bacterium]
MKITRHSAIKRMGLMGTGMFALTLILFSGVACAGPRHIDGRRVEQRRPAAVRTLPRRHTVHRVGPRTVYHHRGTFYQRGRSGYVVVQPPIGIVIPALPSGFSITAFGGNTFFSFGQVTYQRCPKGYRVVERPRHHRPYNKSYNNRSYNRSHNKLYKRSYKRSHKRPPFSSRKRR